MHDIAPSTAARPRHPEEADPSELDASKLRVLPGESPYIPPRLTLRVGVAGHRPNRLEEADTDLIEKRAGDVLACLVAAVGKLKQKDKRRPTPFFEKGPPCLRLTDALAEGSDRIIARVASQKGYEINAILPFEKSIYEKDFELGGVSLEDFEKQIGNDAIKSWTEIDTTQTPKDPAGYEGIVNVILEHSDVLVSVWDGNPAGGPGGTVNIIEEAKRRRLIVVRISTDGGVRLWSLEPGALDPTADGKWLELDLDRREDRCSNALASQVIRLLDIPVSADVLEGKISEKDDEQIEGLANFVKEKVWRGSYAFGYNLLRKIFLWKRSFDFRINYGLSAEQKNAWKKTTRAAKDVGGGSFANKLDRKLRQRWIAADNVALHYSHKFRSTYITNFIFAALAVLVGLIAVLFWEFKGFKAICVAVELVLLLIIFINTFLGVGQKWQQRWLDYRSLAEALRPARLHLLIASSPARPDSSILHTGGGSWVAWYVRASLREIPPPSGTIGQTALNNACAVAIEEEIDGQIDYHTKNAAMLKSLDHRLESTAEWLLGLAVTSGVLYVAFYGLYKAEVVAWVEWFKPLATLLAASLPVFGAAIFGIRATGDFRSARHQSERMANELTALKQILVDRKNLSRKWLDQALNVTSRTMAEDTKLWRTIYSERELTAGF